MDNLDKTYSVKVESLNKLLEEAEADAELTKLADNGEPGVEAREPKEEVVKNDADPTETVENETDVDPVENDDVTEKHAPTASDVEKKEPVEEELEVTGVEEREPKEETVKTLDPIETVESDTDVEPLEKDKTGKTEIEDPTCTEQEGEDIKPAENDDVTEKHVPTTADLEKKEPVEEELEVTGVEEREPKEEVVKTADPTCTEQEGEDIKPAENDDVTNEKGTKIPHPVKLEKKEDETEDKKEDDSKLEEALNNLNDFIETLNEGCKCEDNCDCSSHTDPTHTVYSSTDVEGLKNEESSNIKNADPTCTYQEGEDLEPVPNVDSGKCKSIKDVIKSGSEKYKSEDAKKKLEEHVALLLASENKDLMFEEYSRLIAEAVALKESLVKKYSVISHNRTGTLLENMEAMEAKIAETKNNMFKKLNEQQEINTAKENAKTLSAEEVAFTEINN